MMTMRRFSKFGQAVIAGGVLALLLTACGEDVAPAPAGTTTAETAPTESAETAETPAPQENGGEGPSAQAFTDAFENEGLTCAEVEDPFGKTVTQQFNCEGDDHLIMTIRGYDNTADRDDQLDTIQRMSCEIADQGQDAQRVATSDTWILMAGGDRDVDFEVFEGAMSTLGLDSTDYVCEE